MADERKVDPRNKVCFLTEPQARPQASGTSPQKEHATARIRLRGPILATAVGSMHSALSAIHGVSAVMVSLETQEVVVHLDLYQVNLLQFKRALMAIGVGIDTIALNFDEEFSASARQRA